MSKSTEHSITIYERKIFFITPINPPLTHQEVVPDVVSETLTKKIRSLTSSIINAAANGNLDAKLTITQEEVCVASSTAHIEAALLEKLIASTTSSYKDTPQKRSATTMASSKTRNYKILEILYNLCEDNIFHNKKRNQVCLHYCSVLHKGHRKVWPLHGAYRCRSESRSHKKLKETVG